MKDQDFIIVAPQSWEFEIGSNAKNIAHELAKSNRVLYVNPPLDRITYFRNKSKPVIRQYEDVIKGRKSGLIQIANNLWNLYPEYISESINWIGLQVVYDFLNRRNNRKFADSILEAARQLGFQKPVIFNDNLIFGGLYLKEFLAPSKYIYYIRDYLIVQPYFRKHGVRLEPEIMRKSDAVVANSLYLQEYAQSYNQQSHYIGQGCETDMFNPSAVKLVPEDIRSISFPKIGYVGSLTSMRLDIELLLFLAEKNPSWNIILVGPEDEPFRSSRLHELSNVHFLGKKGPEELPSYVNQFDVCINPQALNPLTIGNYPRKIDEYLAMGKPVVATATRAMDVFKDHVYLASGPADFNDQIALALSEKDPGLITKRIHFAQSHTWENSVEELYKVVHSVITPTDH